MTAAVLGAPEAPGPVRERRHRRAWRAARLTPMTEFSQWGRVTTTLFVLTARASLTYWLWQALYRTTTSAAGLTVRQATTYALLGVVYSTFRIVNRSAARDTMTQHMTTGTIAYWFLRPISPRRFYFIRTCGEMAYSAAWGAVVFTVFRLLGVVEPPPSAAAGLCAAVTLALGFVVLYYVQQLLELVCFWTLANFQIVAMAQIVQNVLAGALIPLWFLPGWFNAADQWLPFQSTLNVPLSLYVGRVPVSATGRDLAVQVLWIVLLAGVTTLVWRRAAARVTVMGG